MAMNTLEDLYLDQLLDLHSAETQLIQALPEMAEAADSRELRDAFEEHLQQTKEHKRRLEKILNGMGQRPNGIVCEGMQGLIQEGHEIIDQEGDPSVLDAGIIAAAQKVEHYEMSGYGTARAFAERLGELDAVDLLQATLDEEKAADKKLTKIAERSVNPSAEGARSGEYEDEE
jgi:ferritin-like metal-binding protein YciE